MTNKGVNFNEFNVLIKYYLDCTTDFNNNPISHYTTISSDIFPVCVFPQTSYCVTQNDGHFQVCFHKYICDQTYWTNIYLQE